jgi:GT2 family glycosyltransferase
MDISIVIVNYNVQYFLEQVLLSVRKAKANHAIEVIVVDNDSVDGSYAMVRSKFPEVQWIQNHQNVGFSKANNQGIVSSLGKYVLLLNPDTVLGEDTLSKCFEFMEENLSCGALGVKMIDGEGKYLPESKRGFPTPWVAFCKSFGLNKLFPKSKTFNGYYLGHLSENETSEIDILAGAFMFLRREALDKSGLLDEDFFMYGEDIDLSYRIQKAGYKNYYLPESTIIHYKGESTKKGSLNYVKVFYQAMIIFANKHFTGSVAKSYVGFLRLVVIMRGMMALFSMWMKRVLPLFFDFVLIFSGLAFLQRWWGYYYFQNSYYYVGGPFLKFNAPLYSMFWIFSIYLSGGYSKNAPYAKVFRGLLTGAILLAAIYGFLDMGYRNSRMLIVLGFLWSLGILFIWRVVLFWIKSKKLWDNSMDIKSILIVADKEESERAQKLLSKAGIHYNFIGTVAPFSVLPIESQNYFLAPISRIEQVIKIYGVQEVICSSKDLSASLIMRLMTKLGNQVALKILPEESESIIGSHSKNEPGELYTIDVRYNINQPIERQQKRVLDIIISICLFLLSPLWIFWSMRNSVFIFKSIISVIKGDYSWVGFLEQGKPTLPKLRPGIFSPSDEFIDSEIDGQMAERIEFLYARDYSIGKDIVIFFKSFFRLKEVLRKKLKLDVKNSFDTIQESTENEGQSTNRNKEIS